MCVFPIYRYFPKLKTAAALLLYKLWSDKELQSFLKNEVKSIILQRPLLFLFHSDLQMEQM